jgi:hypothetical protein
VLITLVELIVRERNLPNFVHSLYCLLMDDLFCLVEMSERREFPWEREWESELDGNGNDSTGMGGNGNRTVPVKR